MTHFEINHPTVVAEILDGEAIIMHFGTGTYYSLSDTGAEIWGLLADGRDLPTVSRIIQSRYAGDPADVDRGVRTLVDALVEADLVRPGVSAQSNTPVDEPVPADRPPFQPPALNIYTDLQDLLLVDPIHDVDPDAGWPQPPLE